MSQRVTSLKMIIGNLKYNKLFQMKFYMENSLTQEIDKDNSKN